MSEKNVVSAVDAVVASVVAEVNAEVAELVFKQGFVRDEKGNETKARRPVGAALRSAVISQAVDAARVALLNAAIKDVEAAAK